VFEKILVTTEARLGGITLPAGIRVEINLHPETGQSSSIRMGIEAATGEWFLFLQADQPLLTVGCLGAILDYTKVNEGKIIYPSIGGSPCSPALFHADFKDELLALSGDMGGRAVRDAHPEACITFEARNQRQFLDIDTMEDYFGLIRSSEFGID
jgi:molybdenum cofactor cytidylyltransferase